MRALGGGLILPAASAPPGRSRTAGREAAHGSRILIHDEKPWLELFQEVIVCGVSRRVSFKPRPDYRLIVSEMAPSR